MKTLQKSDILFEDADLLIINKPSAVTVNRSDTTAKGETVQDIIETYLRLSPYYSLVVVQEGEWKSAEETYKERSGIVHRLDKETSGILVIAKTLEAFIALQKQFKEREVKKTYIALVHGKLSPGQGEINVPLGRLAFNRKRFGVVAGGRESITAYTVLGAYSNPKTNEPLSLVELYPQTGRTHQIRVHLKHVNHPIFSDELYAGRKTARQDRKVLPRLFLHGAKISFIHPRSGQRIEIESPLPQDLETFLISLNKDPVIATREKFG